jgi:hypothetical protein
MELFLIFKMTYIAIGLAGMYYSARYARFPSKTIFVAWLAMCAFVLIRGLTWEIFGI